ncbi:MAG: SDR family NAD(P)-dependent oxidoreductase [Gammaproteobacteria bacterium]|nr:SDR family NAD(P)-dependent oxidoreductase [Gammaproteobacteria bacterium]
MRLFITGAASGIGAAVAARALADGHELIATDANTEMLAEKWGDKTTTYTLDVRDADAWENTLEDVETQHGPIDVLVNIAGVLRSGATGEIEADDVKFMMDVNVNGTIFGTNAMAKRMKQRQQGHIINISSLASLYPVPGITVYSASKYAVRGFTLAAAADLLPYNVAVTAVGPGAVNTAMLDQQRDDPNAALTFSGSRALAPEEIADAVLGHVLKKRPLDCYLPAADGWKGKLANVFPKMLFGQIEKLRKKGAAQYHSKNYS